MNIASLFFAPSKTESLFPTMKVSDDHSSTPSTVTSPNSYPINPPSNGFRKIKKETETPKMKDESQNNITNPFAQNLSQNMLKLLQIMGQTQKTLSQTLVSENQNQTQSLSKIQALFDSLKAKKDEPEHKNKEPQPHLEVLPPCKPQIQNPSKLQNVLLVNGNENQDNKPSLLNKNLYVEFLATLYKQSKQTQKSNEDINLQKILPAGLNAPAEGFNFPVLKKENSSPNHLEENGDSDEMSSTDNVKGKSKKIKKVNLLCGHYTREHYAKNLCNNCYHKYGRTKKPWNCNHEKLYAHGLCQNCYINKYNQQKKNKVKTNENGDKLETSMVKIMEDEKDDMQKTMIEEEISVKNEEKEDSQ